MALFVPHSYAQVSAFAGSTEGFYVSTQIGGNWLSYKDTEDVGSGFGLSLGYGFSDRFGMYLALDAAGMDGSAELPGIASDETYGAVHLELGGRYHFRPGSRLRPYGSLALSAIAMGYETESGSNVGDDIVYVGSGVSLGGGVLYFLSKRFALDAGLSVTQGNFWTQDIDGDATGVDFSVVGARPHFGISFYPFR
jgi:hypothetical protein